MKRLLFLFVMFVTTLTMHAQRYAVLEFQAAKGISVSDVDGISDMFLTYFNPQGYTGVDRGQLNEILAEQHLQHSDVTEEIAVRIGRVNNISKVVLGKVSRLGGGYQVDVRVVDVESARICAKDGETVTGNFRAGVSALAKRLASRISGVSSSTSVPQGYVDLGLPSRTLWKTFNATGFYTYDEAVSQFGARLPSKDQWEELKAECRWQWTGNGYKVTGNNGNSMIMPAEGGRYYGEKIPSFGGLYWSSTHDSEGSSWALVFDSDDVIINTTHDVIGMSIRLVHKQ